MHYDKACMMLVSQQFAKTITQDFQHDLGMLHSIAYDGPYFALWLVLDTRECRHGNQVIRHYAVPT